MLSSVGLNELESASHSEASDHEELDEETSTLLEIYADCVNAWRARPDGKSYYLLDQRGKSSHHPGVGQINKSIELYVWDQARGTLMRFEGGSCALVWSTERQAENAEIWTILPLPPTDPAAIQAEQNQLGQQSDAEMEDAEVDNKPPSNERLAVVSKYMSAAERQKHEQKDAEKHARLQKTKEASKKGKKRVRAELDADAFLAPGGAPPSLNGGAAGGLLQNSAAIADDSIPFAVIGLPTATSPLARDVPTTADRISKLADDLKLNQQCLHELRRLPAVAADHCLNTWQMPSLKVDARAVSTSLLQQLQRSRGEDGWLFAGAVRAFARETKELGVFRPSFVIGSLTLPMLGGAGLPPQVVRIHVTDKEIRLLDLGTGVPIRILEESQLSGLGGGGAGAARNKTSPVDWSLEKNGDTKTIPWRSSICLQVGDCATFRIERREKGMLAYLLGKEGGGAGMLTDGVVAASSAGRGSKEGEISEGVQLARRKNPLIQQAREAVPEERRQVYLQMLEEKLQHCRNQVAERLARDLAEARGEKSL